MNIVARKNWALLPAELQILILETALLKKDPEPKDPLIKYNPPNCSPLVTQHLQFLTPLEQSWKLSTRREELKKARLINSVFCRLLTPVVFATLHISRNTLSIERAIAIASSRLAYHVREIVVHQGGWWHLETHLPLQGPSYSTFLQRVNSHRYRDDYPVDIHPKRVEKALHKNYMEEILSERSLGRDGNLADFGAKMAALPNLVAFTVLPYKVDFNDVETSWYTLKRCGLSYLPEDNIGYDWVCQLANAVQPKALNCSSIRYDVFIELIKRSLKRAAPVPSGYADPFNAFHTLDYLTFNVVESPINREMWPIYRMFPNVETMVLQLGLGGYSAWSQSEQWLSLIPKAGDAPLLPRLARLELDIGCAMKVQDVCSLVLSFQSTLRHLALRNTGLSDTRDHVPSARHGCPEDSLLRALYRIYQQTSLESCIIDASCHDIKDWDPDGEPAPYLNGQHLARQLSVQLIKFSPRKTWPGLETKKRMMAKVSEAMCRRREWPFSLDINLNFSARRDRVQEGAAYFCLAPWDETPDIFENPNAQYPRVAGV